MHLILQKIDFTKNYTMTELQDFIHELELKKILNAEEVKNIDIQKISNFLNHEIYHRIKKAKRMEKEKSFCISLKLEEYKMQEVSVQGMIDLYFIDENDKLVLLDYKTDFVKNEKTLKDRYFSQLEIYKKALEISLNRTVDEMYIYSTHLNKLINL